MKSVVRSFSKTYKAEALEARFAAVAQSNTYSQGPQLHELEVRIDKLYGKQSILCSSAGGGLFAVARYLRSLTGRNLNVAVANNTFYATGAMFYETGARLYLIDSRPDCPSMSFESLVEHSTQRMPDVVVLTHVGGYVAKDYVAIAAFCNKNGITLIEDCAHVFGLVDTPGPAPGSLGFASVFSFYPTKSVPFGEGGAVLTSSLHLAEYVRRFIDYGKVYTGGKIQYTEGFNLRMDEWTAAAGNVQLSYLPQIMCARHRDATRLSNVLGITPLLSGPTSWYKYIAAPGAAPCGVGKVYALTDQLSHSMAAKVSALVDLPNSESWPDRHMCLPLGEGIYDMMDDSQIRESLELPHAS